jgi:hypothetical protein
MFRIKEEEIIWIGKIGRCVSRNLMFMVRVLFAVVDFKLTAVLKLFLFFSRGNMCPVLGPWVALLYNPGVELNTNYSK